MTITGRTAYEPRHDCETCCDSGIDLVFGTPCTECERNKVIASLRNAIARPRKQDPKEINAEILHDTFGNSPPAWLVKVLADTPTKWEDEAWLRAPRPTAPKVNLPVWVWLAIFFSPIMLIIQLTN